MMKDPTIIIIPIMVLALIGYFYKLVRYEKQKKQNDFIEFEPKGNITKMEGHDPAKKFSLIPLGIILFGFYLLVLAWVFFMMGLPSHELGPGITLFGLSMVFIVGGWKLF